MSHDTPYDVYALKDPRHHPARPFYIGKGSGTRAYDHLIRPDNTLKGDRIREIEAAGAQVMVSDWVEHLTEPEALRLEAELIAAFGTLASGGLLTNTVLPSGLGGKSRPRLTVPTGVPEKAQVGLTLLKDAILEFTQANPHGVTNAEVASLLGLRSDYGGGPEDDLSYSLLGLLMRDGKVRRGQGRRHVAQVK